MHSPIHTTKAKLTIPPPAQSLAALGWKTQIQVLGLALRFSCQTASHWPVPGARGARLLLTLAIQGQRK